MCVLQIRQGSLVLADPKDDTVIKTIRLVLSSERRQVRASPFQPAADGAPPQAVTAGTDADAVLKKLAKMAREIKKDLYDRLKPPDDHGRMVRAMTDCLDLRKMAADVGYVAEAKAQRPLEKLYKWLATRDCTTHGQQVQNSVNDMPAFTEVWRQYQQLASRLRAALAEPNFKAQWTGKSGVVIMEAVLTQEQFYGDCGDILYLFLHMATKAMCEAVVEGMGGMWDRCSPDERHQSFETGALEAVIAWSAPPCYHPTATPFITK